MSKLQELAQALPEYFRLIDFVVQQRYRPDDWDRIKGLWPALRDARFDLMVTLVASGRTEERALRIVNDFLGSCERAMVACGETGLQFLPLEELRAEIGRAVDPLLLALNLAEGKASEPPPPEAMARPTIWFHGDQSYSTDGGTPVNLSREMHNALQAFLDKAEAKDTAAMEKVVSNVSKVIDKINKQFPGTVSKPKKKGNGYFIRVRTLAPTG